MAVATITMRENYGLYENKRGYNTIFLPFKTNRYERGGVYYPNTLEEVRNDGIELPFSDYCQKLAAADCNLLRVKWGGENSATNDGWHAIEPPPYGSYNIWQTALDPDVLATYRSQQVTIPIDAGAWAASNMKEFLDQCAANGIGVHVILFMATEFLSAWYYHAWNASNRYTNGTTCEVADRGFLTDPKDMFSNATAIQAAKDRIDFVVSAVGDSKAVVSWELFAEMTYVMLYDFWGEPSWNAAMIANIRNYVTPWVSTMGNYLRAADPYNRPIAIGLFRPPADGIWPANPDAYPNVMNEPMVEYPIDICCMNDYEGSFSRAMQDLRAAREYTDKIMWVTQFSPIQFATSPAEEVSPFLESKKLLWPSLCGMRWGLGPLRWPGLREIASNVWATGGYADSDLYSIPSITKTFAENVNWNATWDTNNYPFDDYVSAAGTSEGNSYGDGEHVTMLTQWSSGGVKTINVSNLSDGAYTFTYYDWTDGSISGTMPLTAVGGSLSISISATGYQDNMIVAHLLKD